MMQINPYGDYYSYDYSAVADDALGVAGAIIGVVLVMYLLMFAFMIAVYVLQSLGFYTIAKRRGIHNPWLAWLPVGNMWILGSISDQYQYVVKSRVRSRRKVLMGLMIAMYALMIPVFAGYGALIAGIITEHSYTGADLMAGAGVTVAVLSYLAMLVLGIIATVFQYIALYDLYASCDPHNSVMYIVLSIFINVTMPFFVFSCRKKDYGMPPRKPQPAPQPPVIETGEEAPVTQQSADEAAPAEQTVIETAPAEELPSEEEKTE